jgi:hypothetical protein
MLFARSMYQRVQCYQVVRRALHVIIYHQCDYHQHWARPSSAQITASQRSLKSFFSCMFSFPTVRSKLIYPMSSSNMSTDRTWWRARAMASAFLLASLLGDSPKNLSLPPVLCSLSIMSTRRHPSLSQIYTKSSPRWVNMPMEASTKLNTACKIPQRLGPWPL